MSRVGSVSGTMAVVDASFLEEWQAFRRGREKGLTRPDGFLSITGLHWLDAEPQRFDGVPGSWSLGPDGVVVELGDAESLTVDAGAIADVVTRIEKGHHVLGPIDEHGIWARAGEVRIEVADRDGAVLLRPRDPAHRLRHDHQPTPVYPPSMEWVATATFTPRASHPAPDDTIGEVAFDLGGRQVTLAAFDDHGGLWLVFSDATSGRTTYPAGRQLYVDPPGGDGSVVLDFNRTINLPCAYTDFTTCPVPPPQNRMPFAVEAGEQDPKRSVAAAQE